jgi:hypothetical protein
MKSIAKPNGKTNNTKALEVSNLKMKEIKAIKVKLNKVAFVSLLYSSAPKPKIFVSLDPLNHKKNNQENRTSIPSKMFLTS